MPTWNDDTAAERHLRIADRRALRVGGGRPVARVRRPADAERLARRTDHARRLREFLALHAVAGRSVPVSACRPPGAVPYRRVIFTDPLPAFHPPSPGPDNSKIPFVSLLGGAGTFDARPPGL